VYSKRKKLRATEINSKTCVFNLQSYGERRGEVYTGFWWGNLRERDHVEDPGLDGRIILR